MKEEFKVISKLPLEIREKFIQEQLNKLSIESQRRICQRFTIEMIEVLVIERNSIRTIIKIQNEFQNINFKKRGIFWIEFDPFTKSFIRYFDYDLIGF